MPVVLVFEGMSQEQYEESVRKVLGKDQAESPDEWPVPGPLAHITGQGPNGFRVVDVWESQGGGRRVRCPPHARPRGDRSAGATGDVRGAHARLCLTRRCEPRLNKRKPRPDRRRGEARIASVRRHIDLSRSYQIVRVGRGLWNAYKKGRFTALSRSGRRGSNPRPSAWEADALPTELRPRSF